MDFLFWLDKIMKNQQPFHVDLYYSKYMDWVLRIWIKNGENETNDVDIFSEQDLDLYLLFAKAEVAVKEWLMNNKGGY